MSQASQLLKDARDRAELLAQALNANGQDPWAKGIAKQRRELRQVYLKLLLLYPYTDESKDAQAAMWMTTSHALIAIFKDRIASSDPDKHQPQPRHNNNAQRTGIREIYRKLLDQFHRFLSDDTRFWRHVALRVQSCFALDDVSVIMMESGLVAEESTKVDALILELFPSQEEVNQVILTEHRQKMGVAMLSKALVCLGDLARYKELYSEGRGRPRAGHEVGPPASASRGRGGTRGRRGRGSYTNTTEHLPAGLGQQQARERTYDQARKLYLSARRLNPHDGNPSHQLGILESYRADDFGTLVCYVRSLCVEAPYDPGVGNMGRMLKRTLEEWKVRQKEENARAGQAESTRGQDTRMPKERIDRLKDDIVVLHALWKFGGDKNERVIARLSKDILDAFTTLLNERHLPDYLIRDMVVVAQGAFWWHSIMLSALSTPQDSRLVSSWIILLHVLGLHRALWDVARNEVMEGLRGAGAVDERITAKMRRMLEAGRETVKWTLANAKLLSGNGPGGTATAMAGSGAGAGRMRAETRKYWVTLAALLSALQRAFGKETLPETQTILAEDMDLQGFLPLQLDSANGDSIVRGLHLGLDALSELHPNEEHLIRIRDILQWAKGLAELTVPPLMYSDGQFAANKDFVQTHEADDQAKVNAVSDMAQDGDDGENLISEAIHTALEGFNISAGQDDLDDDDEQILWNPTVLPSPQEDPAPGFAQPKVAHSPMQPSSPSTRSFLQSGMPPGINTSPPQASSPQRVAFSPARAPHSPLQPISPIRAFVAPPLDSSVLPPGHTSPDSGVGRSPLDHVRPGATALDLLSSFRSYPTSVPLAAQREPQPRVDAHAHTQTQSHYQTLRTDIPPTIAPSSIALNGRSPTDMSFSHGSIWSTAADEPLKSPITRTRTLSYNYPQAGSNHTVGGSTGGSSSTHVHGHVHGNLLGRPSFLEEATPAFPLLPGPYDAHPPMITTTGHYVGQQHQQQYQQYRSLQPENNHGAPQLQPQPAFSPRGFPGASVDSMGSVGQGLAYGRGAGRNELVGFAPTQYYDQTYTSRR